MRYLFQDSAQAILDVFTELFGIRIAYFTVDGANILLLFDVLVEYILYRHLVEVPPSPKEVPHPFDSIRRTGLFGPPYYSLGFQPLSE